MPSEPNLKSSVGHWDVLQNNWICQTFQCWVSFASEELVPRNHGLVRSPRTQSDQPSPVLCQSSINVTVLMRCKLNIMLIWMSVSLIVWERAPIEQCLSGCLSMATTSQWKPMARILDIGLNIRASPTTRCQFQPLDKSSNCLLTLISLKLISI